MSNSRFLVLCAAILVGGFLYATLVGLVTASGRGAEGIPIPTPTYSPIPEDRRISETVTETDTFILIGGFLIIVIGAAITFGRRQTQAHQHDTLDDPYA